ILLKRRISSAAMIVIAIYLVETFTTEKSIRNIYNNYTVSLFRLLVLQDFLPANCLSLYRTARGVQGSYYPCPPYISPSLHYRGMSGC
ncbi:hypothetical protein EV426DRAFT_605895, partial [Tirmania nivea]